MQTKHADRIRRFAQDKYIEPARRRGEKLVRIPVGEVHRQLALGNLVPAVCSALSSQRFLRENFLILEGQQGPPSGQSTTVVYTYRLNDSKRADDEARLASAGLDFKGMRGIARDLFRSLGGGEAFLRRERASFLPSGGRK